MQKNSDHFSIQDAQKLAQNPAARQLMALLQSKNKQQLDQAAALAAQGNYAAAQSLLTQLMQDSDARALFSKLGGI